jgi:hypothetical protein
VAELVQNRLNGVPRLRLLREAVVVFTKAPARIRVRHPAEADSAPVSWLNSARADLVEIYGALGQAEKHVCEPAACHY